MLDTWTSLVLISRPDTTLTSRAGSQPRSRPSWPAAASLSPPGRKNDLHAGTHAVEPTRTTHRVGDLISLPERWKRLHGDRQQCRESMSEYSITCIDMHVDDALISA